MAAAVFNQQRTKFFGFLWHRSLSAKTFFIFTFSLEEPNVYLQSKRSKSQCEFRDNISYVVTHPSVKREIAVINLSSSLVTNGLQSNMLLSYWAFTIIAVGVGERAEEAWGEKEVDLRLCFSFTSKPVRWEILKNPQFALRFPGRLWGRKRNGCLPNALMLAVVATFSQVCLIIYKKQVDLLPLPCYQQDCQWLIKNKLSQSLSPREATQID